MNRTLASASVAALLALTAAPAFAQYQSHGPQGSQGSQGSSMSHGPQNQPGPSMAPAQPGPRGLPSDEFAGARTQHFVTAAAQTDEYERRAGHLAERMGMSPRVREFGTMMVQDHTKTTQDLQAAIRRTGHTVPPPPPLTGRQQQMLAQLKGAGRGFDMVYLQQQVQAHEQALDLMQTYAREGHNPILKDAAAQTAPLVKHHLDMAQGLQGSVRR